MADDSPRKVGFFIESDPDKTTVSRPGQDPARERTRLPLRLLLVSDLAPEEDIEDWSGPSRVAQVDKNTFASVMQKMSPRLRLEVPNKVAETPKLLELDLVFPSLDALHPEQVAQQVPALTQTFKVRTHVQAVRDGKIDTDAFRTRLHEAGIDATWAEDLHKALTVEPTSSPGIAPSAPSRSSGDDALDRLFGMVGGAGDQDTPASSTQDTSQEGLLGSLMQAVSDDTPAKPGVEKGYADQLLADFDRLLDAQLKAVYAHPKFRRFEAAWRGLKFLVDRLNFRRDIRLEVLAAPKEDLEAALYHQVLIPEHERSAEKAPLSAILLDFAFDNGPEDVAQLNDLADTGASLQTPFIGSVSPSFFGAADANGLTRLPVLWQHMERPEYIEWNKLRARKEARHIALALPSFALRNPYGPANAVKAFRFNEEGTLWGGAALAVAVVMGNSFVKTGWPTHVTGDAHRVEDLTPIKGRLGSTPLEVLIPESKHTELGKAGFVVLSSRLNHDAVTLTRASTLCMPESYEDLMAATEAKVHTSLACQLFVARAAHFILDLQDTLEPKENIGDMMQEVETRLRTFLFTEGHTVPQDAVEVDQVPDVDLPDRALLAIRLRPPGFVLYRTVSLVMGVQVPTA